MVSKIWVEYLKYPSDTRYKVNASGPHVGGVHKLALTQSQMILSYCMPADFQCTHFLLIIKESWNTQFCWSRISVSLNARTCNYKGKKVNKKEWRQVNETFSELERDKDCRKRRSDIGMWLCVMHCVTDSCTHGNNLIPISVLFTCNVDALYFCVKQSNVNDCNFT